MQRLRALVRDALNLDRAPRLGVYDHEGFRFALLAKVELDRRARVLGWRRSRRKGLGSVDVSQRYVVRIYRKSLRLRCPLLAYVNLPLGTRKHRTFDVRVGHQEIHGVGIKVLAQVTHNLPQTVRVPLSSHGL